MINLRSAAQEGQRVSSRAKGKYMSNQEAIEFDLKADGGLLPDLNEVLYAESSQDYLAGKYDRYLYPGA